MGLATCIVSALCGFNLIEGHLSTTTLLKKIFEDL
jgi:hypothetical protein